MLLGWIGTLGRRITWHASPAIRSLMWGCVIQDSYLRIGNAQIIKLWKQVVYIVPFWSGSLVFYRWIKINNVKRAQHSPRSAQLLLSYLWFIFFSSSLYPIHYTIYQARCIAHNFFIDINIPIRHKKYRELPPTITFSHTLNYAPCNAFLLYPISPSTCSQLAHYLSTHWK